MLASIALFFLFSWVGSTALKDHRQWPAYEGVQFDQALNKCALYDIDLGAFVNSGQRLYQTDKLTRRTLNLSHYSVARLLAMVKRSHTSIVMDTAQTNTFQWQSHMAESQVQMGCNTQPCGLTLDLAGPCALFRGILDHLHGPQAPL